MNQASTSSSSSPATAASASSPAPSSSPARTWRIPRSMLEDMLGFLVVCWAGTLVTALALAAGINVFGDLTGSIVEPGSGIASWFLGFLGGFIVFTYLPLHIAYGRTRRDTAIEIALTGGVLVIAGAVLMTLAFLVEWAVYGMLDWPRVFESDRLFSSHTDVGAIFLGFLANFLVWATAGALVGACIYREKDAGWFALIPATVLVGIAGSTDGPQPLGFIINRIPAVESDSLLVVLLLAAVSGAIATVATWYVVRDIPLRNRPA